MKKNKLVNIVMIIMIVLSMLFVTKETLAANNTLDIEDLTGAFKNNTVNNANNANNVAGGNNTNVNNSATNNTVLRTNNTTNYNNSALPKTGIEDSFPSVILLVVFGISAIYAYKKIQDYKNI